MICDGNFKELRFRETNNSADKHFFVLGSQLKLSEDSFSVPKIQFGAGKMCFPEQRKQTIQRKINNVDNGGVKFLNMRTTQWQLDKTGESFYIQCNGRLTSVKI